MRKDLKMWISKKDLVKAASLLPALGVLKLGIRFGYGKQLSGVFLKRVGTPEIQAKAFGDYQPTEHDVFVATFVKSGTNWMLQTAQQITQYGAS
ncbi:MAG: sulfotransferase domain-containing protein, partial [Acidobacteria bacterium]|nr:sulfotransferase domain-containing protein [Acidobacteriota bacterium]